jgi:lysyl-tRNA synthetase class 2
MSFGSLSKSCRKVSEKSRKVHKNVHKLSKKIQKFAARTRRNCNALSLKESFEQSHITDEKRWLAGRIIGILDDGFVLQDESDRIDLRYDNEVNIGDIVEALVVGSIETDHNGKKYTVYNVTDFKILTPCTDEFFISKKDPNYRKSVIDRSFGEKMRMRAKILDGIRTFFKEHDFLEVETPSMVKLPGMEPYLDVFKTEFVDIKGNASDRYLITSPEYAMKKLLVGGFEKIFQICKSFRNKEDGSQLHNPEFTLLEWYRAYASYEEIMKDTEELITFLSTFVAQTRGELVERGELKWARKKIKDLFKEYAGISVTDFESKEKFRKVVEKKGYKVNSKTSYDDLFFMVFMNEIEPKLGFDKPVIVYEYPASMAALAKKCPEDPRYAERFEAYIKGIELCNGFTELNDPVEQRERFEEERKKRRKMGKIDYPVDQSFISALKFGMPPSGGNALGVDRLVMLLTETPDISDIISFPQRDL